MVRRAQAGNVGMISTAPKKPSVCRPTRITIDQSTSDSSAQKRGYEQFLNKDILTSNRGQSGLLTYLSDKDEQ